METGLVTKYVRDLEGLRKEVESFKRRSIFPDELGLEELLPIYHETVIFLFAILYKYLVFENIPIFSGGRGLDAWVEHESKTLDIEFEVTSSEFMQQHSDEEKKECDLVVCWRDNSRKIHGLWRHIDVFELKHFWEETAPAT